MISILFQRPVIKGQQPARTANFRIQLLSELHRLPPWVQTSHLRVLVPSEPSLGHLKNAPMASGHSRVYRLHFCHEEVVSCNHFSASQHPSLVCVERVQDRSPGVSEEVRESVWP